MAASVAWVPAGAGWFSAPSAWVAKAAAFAPGGSTGGVADEAPSSVSNSFLAESSTSWMASAALRARSAASPSLEKFRVLRTLPSFRTSARYDFTVRPIGACASETPRQVAIEPGARCVTKRADGR